MKIKGLLLILVSMLIVLSGYILYMHHDELHLKKLTFNQLPSWETADTEHTFRAFKISCKTFLRQNPDTFVGSPYIPLKAKDFYPACQAALSSDLKSNKKRQAFFQQWFVPVEFFNHKPLDGLFTGYYVALLKGSLTKTKTYNVPIYGTPDDLISIDLSLFDSTQINRRIFGRIQGNKVIPYYSRKQINEGAIKKSALVLLWVDSQIDRLFLDIQGSGVVQLEDGSQVFIGYAGQNGAPYTPVGRYLIDKGLINKKDASMQSIRAYLEAHPEDINLVLNQNESFVFFQRLPQAAAIGAQGTALTPGYSLAVDRQWIPLGIPIWLNTTRPSNKNNTQKPLKRLMIAQDTGGAIRGMVRGDVFWGAGDKATAIAGKMKNPGRYWLFLPKHIVRRLEKENIIR